MPFAWAAGAAAVGSVASGVIGSQAAGSAAKTEANAANQASQTELGMFNVDQQNMAPYMGAGTNALAKLQNVLGLTGPAGSGGNPVLGMLGLNANGQATGGGINPATFQGSPGYQYQLGQGMNAVTNSAAMSGGMGGNALKQLQSTGQGLANQDWNTYLSQVNSGYQGLVGNLQGVANNGQSAAANVGAAAMNTGNQVGSNQMAAGGALAQGQINSANAWGGAIKGVGNALGSYMMYGGGGAGGAGGNQSFFSPSNVFSGATGSALGQYMNPYGATGNGMSPIIGMNGMAGGGV